MQKHKHFDYQIDIGVLARALRFSGLLANFTSLFVSNVFAHPDDIARPDGCERARPDGIP